MYKIAFSLAVGLGMALSSLGAAAGEEGCDADEVEVYRDAEKIICANREEYAACIKNAGLQSRADRRNCADSVRGVFADSGIQVGESALKCLASAVDSARSKSISATTLVNCGIAAKNATNALDKAVDKTNECLERVLISQRQREDICKRE